MEELVPSDGLGHHLEPNQFSTPDLVLPNDFTERLRNATTPQEKQAISDQFFTEERRESLLSQTVTDRHGRPVRYYRNSSETSVNKLLGQGVLTASDFYEDPKGKIEDTHELKRYLVNAAEYLKLFSPNDDVEYDRWMDLPLSEQLTRLTRAVGFQKSISEEPSYNEILALSCELPLGYVARVHSASAMQKFSPFLSLSVGAPISNFNVKRPYIEFVLPPDTILLPPDKIKQEVQYGKSGINGEKEILTTQLDRSHITKIWFDPDQFNRDLIYNPHSCIGQINAQRYSTSLDTWRWQTPIFDYLPAKLAEESLREYSE